MARLVEAGQPEAEHLNRIVIPDILYGNDSWRRTRGEWSLSDLRTYPASANMDELVSSENY
jgi:hypothetical protein